VPEVLEKTAYLAGVGQVDVATGAVMYHHADHLGTTRATSDGTGALSAPAVYTAFGENARGLGGTRYQYAGAWGYETGLLPGSSGIPGLAWQHVGHRWYDLSTGRFLQRDPTGVMNGLNVYEYVLSDPVSDVDPSGLGSSMQHPEGFVALIDAQLCAQGGAGATVTVKYGNQVIEVTKVVIEKIGSKSTIIFHTIEGTTKEIAYWGQGPLMKVTEQMGRRGPVVIAEPPGGKPVCGATGFEAVPVLLLTLRGARRKRRRANMNGPVHAWERSR
jgi:RHS repeat-associated protein